MLTGSHRLLPMGICSATGLFRNVKELARPSAWDELNGDGYLCPSCQPGLHVGECVPFYWCPRSVMLFLIHRDNDPDLTYHGGQQPILHLEADLLGTVEWALQHAKRWAFTLSNAGSNYFENRCDLRQLTEVNWDAVSARKWSGRGVPAAVKEGKQAEFPIEDCFPWQLGACPSILQLCGFKWNRTGT
jgi:hypothetical protein